ncbi:Uncharacterised protein [uncultured archaeon]|nr:Uncharacterised protein [uncultured archaeon]
MSFSGKDSQSGVVSQSSSVDSGRGVKGTLISWFRDAVEVMVTVAVILVVLRLALGADMLVPLVVVTSGSMEHHVGDLTWRTWLLDRNVSGVDGFPLTSGFQRGDMIVVKSPDAHLGDVVIYQRDLDHIGFPLGREPIIHRVVGVVSVKDGVVAGWGGTLDCFKPDDFAQFISKVDDCREGKRCVYPSFPSGKEYSFFITKGDNNEATDQCSGRFEISYPVTESQVTGRGFFRIPYVGYIKLAMNFLFMPFSV